MIILFYSKTSVLSAYKIKKYKQGKKKTSDIIALKILKDFKEVSFEKQSIRVSGIKKYQSLSSASYVLKIDILISSTYFEIL